MTARVTANEATFEDARGEDPRGPDITSVIVSNGDDGLITFRVNVPNHPTLSEDMRIRVWVDSDSNRETGLTVNDLAGLDYFLLWDRDGVRLFRCGGSTCGGGPPQRTLGFSYRGGATFTVNAAELEAKRFRFRVETGTGIGFDPATRTYDFAQAKWDHAPTQTGLWSYDVRLGPSRLLAMRFSTTPARPTPGKPLRVGFTATRDDTGAVVPTGRVTCLAKIGGKPAKLRSKGISRGRGRCVFVIPESAEGRTIRGSITIAFGGKQVTKTFSRRIS